MAALIVDDCLETAEALARLVEAAGHAASFIINPLDAVDAVDGMRPHVIFIDIDMPRMDGWRLAGLLHKRFGGDTPRLVAVSGLDGDAARELSRRAGFDAHLMKPLGFDALLEALEPRAPARAP